MGLELAVTCGDPAGVGPEIITGWLAEPAADIRDLTIIGPAPWLATLPDKVRKIAVGIGDFAAIPGEPTGESALVAWAAMERAAEGCRSGEFAGVVTGPVSKSALARIGYAWPGQTEFFAARWGGEPVMAFCGGRLRVVLATWHVPLCEVPQLLGPQLLHRTIAAADTLAKVCRGGGGGPPPPPRGGGGGPPPPPLHTFAKVSAAAMVRCSSCGPSSWGTSHRGTCQVASTTRRRPPQNAITGSPPQRAAKNSVWPGHA